MGCVCYNVNMEENMDLIRNLDGARKWLLGIAELLNYKNEYEAATEVLKYPSLYEVRELAWAEEILKEKENDESFLFT